MEKIRKALSKDSLALAEIHVESFTRAYNNIIPAKVLSNFTVKKRLEKRLWKKINIKNLGGVESIRYRKIFQIIQLLENLL